MSLSNVTSYTNSLNKHTVYSGSKIVKPGKRLKCLLRETFHDDAHRVEQVVKRGEILQGEPIFDILPD